MFLRSGKTPKMIPGIGPSAKGASSLEDNRAIPLQQKAAEEDAAQLKVPVNDDKSLEKEADVMGAKAEQPFASQQPALQTAPVLRYATPQRNTVQGYFLMDVQDGVFMMSQRRRKTQRGTSFLDESGKPNISITHGGSMRVSNDGQMAIENGGNSRQAKTFYASDKVLSSANAKLRSIGSPIRLAFHPGMAITVKVNHKTRKLSLAYPIDLQERKVGHEVTIPQRCNEAGPYVGHTRDSTWLTPKYNEGHGYDLPQYDLFRNVDSRIAAILPLVLKKDIMKNKGHFRMFFETMLPTWENIFPEMDVIQKGDFHTYRRYANKLGGGSGEPDGEHMNLGLDLLGERYIKEFINKVGSEKILREIGLNEFIDPKIGDVLSIRSIAAPRLTEEGTMEAMDHLSGRMLSNPFEYHFATVIAKSGSDYITMENYARQTEEGNIETGAGAHDPRYFFQMFGPLEQSFHSENKSDYANPLTLRFSPDGRQPQNFGGRELESDSVQEVIHNYNRQLSGLY